MRIAIVAGCRPEFVKLSPVVQALRNRQVNPTIVSTGQHTDLLRGTPFENVMAPNVSLGLPGSNDPLVYGRDCGRALAKLFRLDRPDVIVVQGDTASAYAGACVGKWLEIPVAHVEAGIRTGDPWDPWPEENFRVSIDRIARTHFYATRANFANAWSEWSIGQDAATALGMTVTGNTGIDALYSHTQPVEDIHKVDRVLITLHRRESFGNPLHAMVTGILQAAGRYPMIKFIWPSHPNPRVQEMIPAHISLKNLAIQGPADTVPFAQMLSTSRAVITDSGGVQEEAAALGIPCIVAREKTDRPESVEIGLAKVAGRTAGGIVQGLAWALDSKLAPSTCFGDGHAAGRIVAHLLG